MNLRSSPLLARKLSSLGLLVAWAFAGCKDSSKDASQPAPSASASTTAPAPSAEPSTDPSTASKADQVQVGDEYDDADPSAVTDFHGALDPHGGWVDDGKYGTVWVPARSAVGADFVPYQTGGHWAYGDDYTWVSDYDWGWAPFHYGRWVLIDGRGWAWIPGRRYAPAWVTWRVGSPGFGYVGWAPLAPEWGWRAGVVVSFGFPVLPHFSYCGTVDLFAPRLSARVLAGPQVAVAEGGTRVWAEGSVRGGRVAGPPPSRCGIATEAVVHVSANDPGTRHAQEFSKPSTAVALGAHPPARGASAPVIVHAKEAPGRDRPGESSGTLTNRPGGGLPENGGGKGPARTDDHADHGDRTEHGGGNKGSKPEPKHK
jgi:hypothetical protein